MSTPTETYTAFFLLGLGLLPLTASAHTGLDVSNGTGTMTELQCLQAQHEWIDDCLDWWTSLTGNLDDCIESFDATYPSCALLDVSGVEAAEEVHEAYGPAGEIIGGGLGVIGGLLIDTVHCAGGVLIGTWVLSEGASIYVLEEDFGAYGISDEAVAAAEAACWATTENAVVLGTAVVLPEVLATVVVTDLAYQAKLCIDACLGSPDPYTCTEACYEGLGTHAAAVLGFLGGGYLATRPLPPEFLAPEAFNCRLRPGFLDGPPVEEAAPECLDDAFTEFRYNINDPTYLENTVENYGFSEPPNLTAQMEALNIETGSRMGGSWIQENAGSLTQSELMNLMENMPVDTYGIAAGHSHATESNHAIFLKTGPGGVSTAQSNGFTWEAYDLYIYHPGPYTY